MKTLIDFKLWESLSKINNFKTGGITTVSTIPRTIKKIFVPKKMFINTCVKMPICFTNLTSSTSCTRKLVHNTWFKRLGKKSSGLKKTTEQSVDTSTSHTSKCHFYKLPYIGFYSTYTGKKISSIINKYYKDLNVKVIFSPLKLSNMLSPKDFIPESLKSRVVYQFK